MNAIDDASVAGTMQFDHKKREELRKKYNQARKNRKGSFKFEGHMFNTRYAQYLLEYLDAKIIPKKSNVGSKQISG